MKRILLLSCILAATFVSCIKEGKLTYQERRLVGTWVFDKAKYTDRWSLLPEDILHEMDEVTIIFEDDLSVTYVDAAAGTSFSGVWEHNIDQVSENAGDNQLVISLVNDADGTPKTIIWDSFTTFKNKVNVCLTEKDGSYRYRLRRQ